MKAILLAGGTGTRLRPITLVLNKHLLPVFNKPMIYYPLSLLILIGVREILLTTHAKEMPLFKELLGDGSQFGIKISYEIQEKAGGIAEVLKISKNFLTNTNRFIVALGDNIYHIPHLKQCFHNLCNLTQGAGIVLCPVPDPNRFGVAQVEGDKVISIEEKPTKTDSNLAVTGIYFYDNQALEFVNTLKPSARGELEITDINNKYLEKDQLYSTTLSRSALWLDTGTPDSMFEAAEFIKIAEKTHNIMIGSPEEVAFNEGLITAQQLGKLITTMNQQSEYRKYLQNLIK
jgi:glucose-1-phosphate thymidylyltransferase